MSCIAFRCVAEQDAMRSMGIAIMTHPVPRLCSGRVERKDMPRVVRDSLRVEAPYPPLAADFMHQSILTEGRRVGIKAPG